MSPPHLWGLILASSTGLCPGFWLLVVQPSSVLPSNNRIQPSSLSRSVSWLSAAAGGAAPSSERKQASVARLMHDSDLFTGWLSTAGGKKRGSATDDNCGGGETGTEVTTKKKKGKIV